MIDRDALQKIAEENLENNISIALSAKGYCSDIIQLLFKFTSRLFKEIPPDIISWKFKNVVLPNGFHIADNEIVHISKIKENFVKQSTLVVLDEYRCIILDYDYNFDGQAIFSYNYYKPMNECFYVDDVEIPIKRYVDSASCSIFMIPTYKELDEAMMVYYETMAKHSVCSILAQMWADSERLAFCIKPEHYMRDSLWQFLRNTLRSHSVKREQNVDETHPVDIKVTWPVSNIVALIEVKWLGDSGNTVYRDARANEGAKQLIDYINASYIEEADKNFVGYLTVFDGRRQSNNVEYFRTVEINYKDEYLQDNRMKYMRFYLEPKLKVG